MNSVSLTGPPFERTPLQVKSPSGWSITVTVCVCFQANGAETVIVHPTRGIILQLVH